MAGLNEELLEFQKVDGELRKIEQELSASEERKKSLQAKKFVEGAETKIAVQDARAIELKHTASLLASRCKEMQKSIDEYADLDEMVEEGGDVSFYKKNAHALSEKLRALKSDMQKLLFEMDAISAEYAKVMEQGRQMTRQYREYNKKYQDLRASRSAEIDAINARLNEIAKKIPKEVLDKYRQKRKERIFPVVVPLAGSGCICGVGLSVAQIGKLDGGNVIECENCRRFIYKA